MIRMVHSTLLFELQQFESQPQTLSRRRREKVTMEKYRTRLRMTRGLLTSMFFWVCSLRPIRRMTEREDPLEAGSCGSTQSLRAGLYSRTGRWPAYQQIIIVNLNWLPMTGRRHMLEFPVNRRLVEVSFVSDSVQSSLALPFGSLPNLALTPFSHKSHLS